MSWESIALPIILSLATAMVALLAWANRKWGILVDSTVKNDYANGALKRLALLVTAVVKEIQQTVVEGLKADEEWDADTAKKAKAAALAKIREYLGPEGLAELMEVLGLSDGALLYKLLESFIEAQVNDLQAGTIDMSESANAA